MQGPFMVGSKEEEVPSKERCRVVRFNVKGLRIGASSEDGAYIKRLKNKGDQTPGFFWVLLFYFYFCFPFLNLCLFF